MKHKIRMIGLDLDGTLLTTQKKITSYTKAVLEEALAKGIVVLVSTGRPISAVPKEILEIPGMKYAVTANGARVLDIETGEVIVENMLSLETAEKVLRIFQKYNTIHEIFIGSEGYTSKSVAHAYEYFKNPSMAEYFMNTRIPVDDVVAEMLKKGEPVDKVQGIFKNEDERKKAEKELEVIEGITVSNAIGNNLEANKEGVDKGMALVQLGKMLGIRREEIMACGDGMNDYEMLKTVGFAVAMENGEEELKVIADYITVSNDEDGVAKAIQKFAL